MLKRKLVSLCQGSIRAWPALLGTALLAFSACGVQIHALRLSNSGSPEAGIANKPIQIKASDGTICAVLDSGETTCWGAASYAQLANGTGFVGESLTQMGNSLTPVNFGIGRSAKALGGGSWHQCAVLDDDTAKCWGRDNTYGQLGYGDFVARNRPPTETLSLGTGKVPVKIVGGHYFSCARFSDSTVKCWGINTDGQLGQGNTNALGDGPGEMGDSLPVINLGTGKTAKDIEAGLYHVCAILNDDTVKCWGRGGNGRLGYGNTTTRGSLANQMGDNLPVVDLGTSRTAKKLSLGANHTCALLDDNKVKCWGLNTFGRLGLGDTTDRGSLVNQMGNNLPYVNLGTGQTAKSIQANSSSTCAILMNNTLKCWGENTKGALGLGDANPRGVNAVEMGDNLPVVDLGAGVSAVSLMAQGNSGGFCAILNDSKVKCWGNNDNFQLGMGSALASWGASANQMGDNLPVVNFGTDKTVTALTSSTYGVCGLLNDGTLRCFGLNDGSLGTNASSVGDDPGETGSALPRLNFGTGLTVKTIAPAFNPCALFTNGSLKCWGFNTYGVTGQGNTAILGDHLSETPDTFPFIDLGTGRTVTKLFNQGAFHACALLDNGTLKCWGANSYGQLGLGDVNVRGDTANEMGDNLPVVNVGTGKTVLDIAQGRYHTCAKLNDSSVKCWGHNTYGQLGYGNTTVKGNAVNQMGDNLAVVNLGTGRTAKTLANGNYHSCAILDDDTVKCWGFNNYGQLGLGDTVNRGGAANQMGDFLPTVNLGTGRKAKSIYAGAYFTCAFLDDNSLKCWGSNEVGQLGQGDLINRGDAVNQMGDSLPPISLGTGRTLKEVVLSGNTTNVCAVLDNDTLKCWGSGTTGILATGNSTNIGGAPGEMGDALQPVNFGTRAAP